MKIRISTEMIVDIKEEDFKKIDILLTDKFFEKYKIILSGRILSPISLGHCLTGKIESV